jgi:hypothetical protein
MVLIICQETGLRNTCFCPGQVYPKTRTIRQIICVKTIEYLCRIYVKISGNKREKVSQK